MSEEEKKAIERIKQEIDRYKAIETPKEVYITDIKILLSLIKKQQKEIKELKEKEKNLLKQLKDSEKELLEVTQNVVNKDKIRAKIKDLKENNNGDDYSITNVIMILKELLDELEDNSLNKSNNDLNDLNDLQIIKIIGVKDE